eukprot:TRINITY_DN12112_c0_g1_i1.p1 TRINITY_DN12112_c0_g1~~TRINITY_DN12112_c0_g1_i1.p1  ORF type:complete len:185 (-),score=10.82 TRINITY_DN12112_c0_g1_i1:25-579(-)
MPIQNICSVRGKTRQNPQPACRARMSQETVPPPGFTQRFYVDPSAPEIEFIYISKFIAHIGGILLEYPVEGNTIDHHYVVMHHRWALQPRARDMSAEKLCAHVSALYSLGWEILNPSAIFEAMVRPSRLVCDVLTSPNGFVHLFDLEECANLLEEYVVGIMKQDLRKAFEVWRDSFIPSSPFLF